MSNVRALHKTTLGFKWKFFLKQVEKMLTKLGYCIVI